MSANVQLAATRRANRDVAVRQQRARLTGGSHRNRALTEAKKQSILANGGRVSLHLKAARGLAAKDWHLDGKYSSDAYIRVLSGGEREVARTKIIPSSLNPEWDEKFSFYVSGDERPMIVLQIYDSDWLTPDDPMGTVTVPLSLLVDGRVIDGALGVDKCEGANDAKGEVLMAVVYDPR